MNEFKIPDKSEVYFSGKHYDAFSRQDDFAFYLEFCKKAGGEILELACGTGRLTIPLAEKGLRITGIDISSPMLREARRKAKSKKLGIKFVKGDIRGFSLKKKFSLIFLAFNSMHHLKSIRDIEEMFSRVREHLSPEGLFICDIFNPNPHYLVRDPREALPIGFYPDPRGRGKILVNEYYRYDRKSQISKIKWEYVKGRKTLFVKKLNMRCFYPEEIKALFRYNGFRILKRYGTFGKKPFSEKSEKQIIIAKTA